MGWAEGPVEKYLFDETIRLKGKIRKVKWIGKDGAPDRLVWWPLEGGLPLRFAFIEVKSHVGKVNPSQQREMKRLKDDGFPVYIVRSKDDVDRVLAEIRGGGII